MSLVNGVNTTELYVGLAQANIFKPKNGIPKYLIEKGEELKSSQQKKELDDAVARELTRLEKETENVVNEAEFHGRSEDLEKRLQLLWDAVRYRKPENHEALENKIKEFAQTKDIKYDWDRKGDLSGAEGSSGTEVSPGAEDSSGAEGSSGTEVSSGTEGSSGKDDPSGKPASPMHEGDKQVLESILKAHFKDAITSLREYITDGQSKGELENINQQIRTDIEKKLSWRGKEVAKFQLPFTDIKTELGPGVGEAFKELSKNVEDEPANKVLRQAKTKLYHFCHDRGLQLEWFVELFPGVSNGQGLRRRALYAPENRDATLFWPYDWESDGEIVVLFEKRTKYLDGFKSTYGVQIYDEHAQRYRVELRGKIGSLKERWHRNTAAYTFEASKRRYNKSEHGEVEFIYFYTISPMKTGDAAKRQSNANTEFCVKFQKSMSPQMIPKSRLISFLPDGVDLDKITQDLSIRDKILEPWKAVPDKIFFKMNTSTSNIGQRGGVWGEYLPGFAGQLPSESIKRGGSPYARQAKRESSPSALSSGNDEEVDQVISDKVEKAMSSYRNDIDKSISGLWTEMQEFGGDLENIKQNAVTKDYLDKKNRDLVTELLAGLKK